MVGKSKDRVRVVHGLYMGGPILTTLRGPGMIRTK